jgi:hypothetical protein
MSPNRKLTNAIKGRTIANFETEGGAMTVRFTDGTTMRVKGAPQGSVAVPQGGQVTQAFEQGNRFALHFNNQTSVVLKLENPGNAVAVRDGESKVLYMG